MVLTITILWRWWQLAAPGAATVKLQALGAKVAEPGGLAPAQQLLLGEPAVAPEDVPSWVH